MSYLREHDEHGSYSFGIVYISSWLGTIELEECDTCGYLNVLCTHENNSWTEDETQLLCDLCGADGT